VRPLLCPEVRGEGGDDPNRRRISRRAARRARDLDRRQARARRDGASGLEAGRRPQGAHVRHGARTCEQWIKEGKGAINWTWLSCRSFAANAVRLQLHALAYNLGNFVRTLAMPKSAEPWSLTSLGEKLIKIGAKVVSHGRSTTFQMVEVAMPRQMFQSIMSLIARIRARPAPA
jgi:hypothetical protein